MKQVITALLDDDAIYNKIIELTKTNPKFIYHIIRSNYPGKTKRVESFVKQNLKNRRCCISDQTLIDVEGAAKILSIKGNAPHGMMYDMLLDKRTLIQQIDSNIVSKRLALIGEQSDKMICLQTYNQLMLYIKNQVNDNNFTYIRIVTDEIVKTLYEDAINRFDLTIKFKKITEKQQQMFCLFIDERSIPGMKLNYGFIWEKMSSMKNSI